MPYNCGKMKKLLLTKHNGKCVNFPLCMNFKQDKILRYSFFWVVTQRRLV